ncbi:MAG: alpha/beta hydrolase, partial [Isosphaeraceae bacterium]
MRNTLGLFLSVAVALSAPLRAGADTVILKNGTVYRGLVDTDNTIVSIFDGMTRTVVRDTKIERTIHGAEPKYEQFPLLGQPLEVHGGKMPTYAINIKATPWDAFGRRRFEYVGPGSSKPVKMTQAMNLLGPKTVRIRGVDGFWTGLLPTSLVPKDVVLGLLRQVDQTDQNSRLSVNRFLIQAEWYPEALAELDRLGLDFTEMAETAKVVRQSVIELSAGEALAEIKIRLRAQQPAQALSKLKTFPGEGAPTPVLVEVRDLLRQVETRADEDKALAVSVSRAAEAVPEEVRKETTAEVVEVLTALEAAPDAVRGRFDAFRKARDEPGVTPETRLALALSGWVAGSEGAVSDLKSARALWQGRDAVLAYLASADDVARSESLATLNTLEIVDADSQGATKLDLKTLIRLSRQTVPPLREARLEEPGASKLVRVRDDPNPNEPTEY